jgi:N-carbamoyl-L-amino-acid hydrolase
MPQRRDALCAASEIILATEKAARATGAIDTVATVGICEVFPGAVNSIPSRVLLSLDVRDTNLSRRNEVLHAIEQATRSVAEKRNVAIESQQINADAPADCAPRVSEALADACREHHLPFLSMVSRAYHDSLFMSRIAPAGMLFIPCREGFSHRPDEYAAPEDIARGALVLAETLALLAA